MVDLAGAFGAAGAGVQDAEARAELPARLSFGLRQEITEDLRLLGEFQIQYWSAFDQIVITNQNNGVSNAETQNYDDAIFAAIGLEGDVSDRLTLRGCVAGGLFCARQTWARIN